MEIKDCIVERLQKLEDLTQEKYDEVVKAVLAEHSAGKKITDDEAKELEATLREDFEAIKKTIHKHTAPGKTP